MVSANQLCRILETAEQADGSPPPMESSSSEAAMSPLPSTPPESLRPEDEDQWSKAEDRAEKRAEKEDEDFPPPKRHCA